MHVDNLLFITHLSQQPLETLLFSWFQSIPAWVPMYMWGFVCTRGYLSWIEWSLASVCSLSISEIAVWFHTVNDLSNVNLLCYSTSSVCMTGWTGFVCRKCECQANSSAQLLFLPSTGTINSKHGGRGRDGVQGSYRLWLQVRHFWCCHQFKDVLIIITFASSFLSTSCLWLPLKQRLSSLYLNQ